MDERELVANPVSIIQLENEMFEETMVRMQMELSRGWDTIVTSPSMGAEIEGSLKDLYKYFMQVEESWGRGEETHRRIRGSLDQIEG